MTLGRRAPVAGALGVAAALLAAPTARAQVPVRDSTARADSAARPDSAATSSDSVPPPTSLTLLPLETAPGPLAPGARLTFTRDSLLWVSGYTLADLLHEVPGVYVAHTGFVGQPAPAFYAGRGTAGLEIYRDGIPLVPLGPDSVAFDPGRISLFGLRRVEVERLPGLLRVHLISERNELVGSRSLLRVVSGDFKTGSYSGLFQQRWASGLGFDLTADYFDTQGDREPQRNARWFNLGARVDWTPTPRLAATVDIRRANVRRVGSSGDQGNLPARDEAITEAMVRVVAAQHPERRGLSFETGFQTTAWRADSAGPDTVLSAPTVHRAFVGFAARGVNANASAQLIVGDYYTPTAGTAQLNWRPFTGVILSATGLWARHDSARTSRRATASLGLYHGPWSVSGDVAVGDLVAAPSLRDDTTQTVGAAGVRGGLTTRRVSFHGALERRQGFTPPGLTSLAPFSAFPASPTASYATGDFALRAGAIALTGWVAQPLGGADVSYAPPSQSRIALTWRSKYWRTFRSGAFDLKAQIAVDAWSDGIAALDDGGVPIRLPGATITEAFLEIQLVQFRAFYSLRNALRSEEWYVPGFQLFRVVQTFGVKWDFSN